MKNKGFTLIELLAVIVILAIIALIATPMILGVIDTAKRGSAESAALGYVDAVEKSIMLNQVKGENPVSISTSTTYYVVSEGLATSENGAAIIKVDVKGETPKAGSTVKFKTTSGEVSEAKLTFEKIHANLVTYTPSNGAKIAS